MLASTIIFFKETSCFILQFVEILRIRTLKHVFSGNNIPGDFFTKQFMQKQ